MHVHVDVCVCVYVCLNPVENYKLAIFQGENEVAYLLLEHIKSIFYFTGGKSLFK